MTTILLISIVRGVPDYIVVPFARLGHYEYIYRGRTEERDEINRVVGS